ncbi:MAG: hypothetical protein JWN04_4203 [Myxococcaceae bacterium]|nr:hypothetical protein [Myxococcaceae bacterium]
MTAPRYDLDLTPRSSGATGYIVPGTVSNLRSSFAVAFGHVLETGPDSYRYAAALRELGLTSVDSAYDILALPLEALEAVVVRADAAEAQRVERIRAGRAARLAEMTAGEEGFTKARRKHTKNVIPKCEAIARALRAEHGADDDLAAFLDAVDAAAAEGMVFSSAESFYRAQRETAEKEMAAPIPAEDFALMRIQGLTRGWMPDALDFVRGVLDDRRKERAAHVARIRADLQLAGAL